MAINFRNRVGRYDRITEFEAKATAFGADDAAPSGATTTWYGVYGSNTLQFFIVPDGTVTSYDVKVYQLLDNVWVEMLGEARTGLTAQHERQINVTTKQVYIRIFNIAGSGNVTTYAGSF